MVVCKLFIASFLSVSFIHKIFQFKITKYLNYKWFWKEGKNLVKGRCSFLCLSSFLWHGIASFDEETAQWVRGPRWSRFTWTKQKWRQRENAKCSPLGSFQFISPSFSLTQVQKNTKKNFWYREYNILGFSLRCYSDLSSGEASRCEERKGFRSCFVKYDKGSKVFKIQIGTDML